MAVNASLACSGFQLTLISIALDFHTFLPRTRSRYRSVGGWRPELAEDLEQAEDARRHVEAQPFGERAPAERVVADTLHLRQVRLEPAQLRPVADHFRCGLVHLHQRNRQQSKL